jgi:hypothetical protein
MKKSELQQLIREEIKKQGVISSLNKQASETMVGLFEKITKIFKSAGVTAGMDEDDIEKLLISIISKEGITEDQAKKLATSLIDSAKLVGMFEQ